MRNKRNNIFKEKNQSYQIIRHEVSQVALLSQRDRAILQEYKTYSTSSEIFYCQLVRLQICRCVQIHFTLFSLRRGRPH